MFPEATIRYHDGSGICQQDDILRVKIGRELKVMKLARKEVKAMYGKPEQEPETLKECNKVLVPVRRSEVENKAEQEIHEEPRLAEQWQIPR